VRIVSGSKITAEKNVRPGKKKEEEEGLVGEYQSTPERKSQAEEKKGTGRGSDRPLAISEV
jgi:hypothetical protein